MSDLLVLLVQYYDRSYYDDTNYYDYDDTRYYDDYGGEWRGRGRDRPNSPHYRGGRGRGRVNR